jgi:hypothetical protein
MAIISVPNTFSPNTTISSSEINANFTEIYDEFNGNIAAANLATDSVTTVKIADSNVTTAKIADDAVTAAKINWAATGANAGIWWEEIGRHTPDSTVAALTASFAPRKYLMVKIVGVASGGTLDTQLTLNGDSGSNYASRYMASFGTVTNATSASSFPVESGATDDGSISQTVVEITNIATEEKIVKWDNISIDAAGAATNVASIQGTGKWANTSDDVTTVTLTDGGAGDFGVGSELIVLGHN